MLRFTLIVLVMLAAGMPVRADDCPVGPERAPTLRALQSAPDCKESLRLLEACAWGNGRDAEFAHVVVRRCERTFLDALSPAERQAYEAEKQACRTRHAERGTENVSFAAICEAKAAARRAR